MNMNILDWSQSIVRGTWAWQCAWLEHLGRFEIELKWQMSPNSCLFIHFMLHRRFGSYFERSTVVSLNVLPAQTENGIENVDQIERCCILVLNVSAWKPVSHCRFVFQQFLSHDYLSHMWGLRGMCRTISLSLMNNFHFSSFVINCSVSSVFDAITLKAVHDWMNK